MRPEKRQRDKTHGATDMSDRLPRMGSAMVYQMRAGAAEDKCRGRDVRLGGEKVEKAAAVDVC